jgi:hypothetical protein
MPAEPLLIGREAAIPVAISGVDGHGTMALDLFEPYGLRFRINDQRFVVGIDALQSLLDAYREMQARTAALTHDDGADPR